MHSEAEIVAKYLRARLGQIVQEAQSQKQPFSPRAQQKYEIRMQKYENKIRNYQTLISIFEQLASVDLYETVPTQFGHDNLSQLKRASQCESVVNMFYQKYQNELERVANQQPAKGKETIAHGMRFWHNLEQTITQKLKTPWPQSEYVQPATYTHGGGP